MPRLIDLTGQRFGRLVVVSRSFRESQKPRWNCECDCGETVDVLGDSLRSGRTRSSGCIHTEWVAENLRTHGLSQHRIYVIWQGMIRRCTDEKYHAFANYGGRGITVCEEWQDFERFASDMGLPPSGKHTLDRIDNNENYCPSNCKWSSDSEQRNNKRTSRRLTAFGKTQTITQWSSEIGLCVSGINWRLDHGRSVEQALTR